MDPLSLERLQNIIQHAYARAPAVKVIMDEAGVSPEEIQAFADLDKIPVTSKDQLVELQVAKPPFGGFLAVPLDELQHIFLSPGPLYEPQTSESTAMDTIREMLNIAGFSAGDVVLNAFSYHLSPSGVIGDQVLREAGACVIPAGVGNAELQIKVMSDLGVTGYVGTPSWLMALIQKAEESGMDFTQDLALTKALVSAEPLPPNMREILVDKYGFKVTNAYGTAELGFLAYNTEGGLAMRLLESSIVQVTNPDTGKSVSTGEVGEVVVTTFNKTYPLIRLGTGDLAMNVDPAPGKSRQGERSIILVGRVGDAVKVRGMFLHPNQLRFAIGQVPGISRVQAIVIRPKNRDELLLQVVIVGEDVNRESLTTTISQAVKATCRINVDRIEYVSEGELGESESIIVDKRIW